VEKEALKKNILHKIKNIDGKRQLFCVDAFKLAEELKLTLSEIGNICNEEKIKISHCQLGCFK